MKICSLQLYMYTFPAINIATEKLLSQKENIESSHHPFSGAMLISGMVSIYIASIYIFGVLFL